MVIRTSKIDEGMLRRQVKDKTRRTRPTTQIRVTKKRHLIRKGDQRHCNVECIILISKYCNAKLTLLAFHGY